MTKDRAAEIADQLHDVHYGDWPEIIRAGLAAAREEGERKGREEMAEDVIKAIGAPGWKTPTEIVRALAAKEKSDTP